MAKKEKKSSKKEEKKLKKAGAIEIKTENKEQKVKKVKEKKSNKKVEKGEAKKVALKKPVTKKAPTKKQPVKKTISKKTANKKTTAAPRKPNIEQLSTFFNSIKEKNIAPILEDLMTPKEIKEFAERIEILKQLKAGTPQRAIASSLGISVTTVSRGSKVLQTGKQVIKKYL